MILVRFIFFTETNACAPGKKEVGPPPPNNDTQTKSTTVCHKQGISITKMNR